MATNRSDDENEFLEQVFKTQGLQNEGKPDFTFIWADLPRPAGGGNSQKDHIIEEYSNGGYSLNRPIQFF